LSPYSKTDAGVISEIPKSVLSRKMISLAVQFISISICIDLYHHSCSGNSPIEALRDSMGRRPLFGESIQSLKKSTAAFAALGV